MKTYLGTALVLLLAGVLTKATAQTSNKWKIQLGYNISAPLGSFKNNFITNTSFKGAIGELAYSINPKVAVGLSAGYQHYYQKYGRQVYHTGPNQDVSAVLSNNLEVIPLLLKGSFSPLGDQPGMIRPYVSAGAGVNLVNYSQYLGEFPGTDGSATFAGQVGAGVLIPFTKRNTGTGFKLGATYNYGAYNRNDIKNLNSAGVHAGVVFHLK